jgi:tRNA A37 N6-isopentenylltransferase MiaA
MKNFMKINILVILGISLALLLTTGGSNIYAQNLTNQTSGQNATQQQLQQANQTQQQANQTQQQANQTQQQDPKMNEKLLNYTNAAILALNDDNTDAAQTSLQQIQSALINATGKQVVIVPAPEVSSSDGSDDGDSS